MRGSGRHAVGYTLILMNYLYYRAEIPMLWELVCYERKWETCCRLHINSNELFVL